MSTFFIEDDLVIDIDNILWIDVNDNERNKKKFPYVIYISSERYCAEYGIIAAAYGRLVKFIKEKEKEKKEIADLQKELLRAQLKELDK